MKSLESSMTPMTGGLRRDPERCCREAQGAGRAGRAAAHTFFGSEVWWGWHRGVMCPKMAVLVERMMKDLEGWKFGGTQFADKPLLCSHVRSELFHFAAERFHVQVSNQTNPGGFWWYFNIFYGALPENSPTMSMVYHHFPMTGMAPFLMFLVRLTWPWWHRRPRTRQTLRRISMTRRRTWKARRRTWRPGLWRNL